MAETSTRVRYTGQQVLEFLEEEEDGMEDTFFPGSDDDLGMNESDSECRDEEEEEEEGVER